MTEITEGGGEVALGGFANGRSPRRRRGAEENREDQSQNRRAQRWQRENALPRTMASGVFLRKFTAETQRKIERTRVKIGGRRGGRGKMLCPGRWRRGGFQLRSYRCESVCIRGPFSSSISRHSTLCFSPSAFQSKWRTAWS